MAELSRLAVCRRCRRTFIGRPGEKYCADCRKEMRIQGHRRAIAAVRGPWRPLGTYALLSLGLGLVVGLLRPSLAGDATWVGAILAILQVGRQL